MPIFAALGLTATGILLIFEGDVNPAAETVYAHFNKPILMTVPLFVFMAQIMIKAKVIDDPFGMAHTLIGHIRGGLGAATVLSCTIFAAISGSSVATALSIDSSAVPQMKRFGYPEKDALGLVAAGGTLGILIPPSGPMILYAIVSDASIGALFLAGIIPGVMLAVMFSAYCIVKSTLDPEFESQPCAGLPEVGRALTRSFWAVMAPPVVMGGIYLGIFTAGEAAAVGCLYALSVAFVIYRIISLADLWECLIKTMRMSMMVFMIIAGAAMFGHAITIIRLPNGSRKWWLSWGLVRLPSSWL